MEIYSNKHPKDTNWIFFFKKKKKHIYWTVLFFCITLHAAPARQIWPGLTQLVLFCRGGEDSAFSSNKFQHYPRISRKQWRGSESGGAVNGLARECRYAKNNSIVRERTTNTAAGSHTLTSTHCMAAWLWQKHTHTHATHAEKLNCRHDPRLHNQTLNSQKKQGDVRRKKLNLHPSCLFFKWCEHTLVGAKTGT